MRRALAALLIAGGGVFVLADTVSDATRAELARERRRLSSDVRNLVDISRRVETSLSQLTAAARAVSDSAGRGDPPDEVARREDAVSAAEQEVHALLERRRILADRVVERRRTIVVLESDLVSRKAADAVTGRWSVLLDPGEQKGAFRLNLSGTIVSGEYTLEGGYSGSLRGTLVNDLLRLERVDSALGFSTVYYGRVAWDSGTIAGTWESTDLSGTTPSPGRWRAVREDEEAQ